MRRTQRFGSSSWNALLALACLAALCGGTAGSMSGDLAWAYPGSALSQEPAPESDPSFDPNAAETDPPEDGDAPAADPTAENTDAEFVKSLDSEPEVPPEQDVDAKGEPEEDLPFAKLVVTADSACYVYANDEYLGSISEPGVPVELGVSSRIVKLAGVSTVVSGARFDQKEGDELELEEGEVREFAIPMLEAIEDFRKMERRDRVWRDLDRGLMWPRNDNAANVTLAGAESYCRDLELGAFENWRLPTAVELETIEQIWSLRPYKTVDAIYLSSCCAWSSTKPSDRTAFTVDFRYRRRFESNQGLSYGLRALCVREMLASELAESLLAADPKEQKRRLKEKRLRQDEKRRREAEKAAKRAAKPPEDEPDGR